MGEEEKKDVRQYKANGPPHLEFTQSTNSGASARVKVVWKIAPPIQVAMTNMKTILASQLKSQTQTKPMTENGGLPYEHFFGAEGQK